MGAQRRVCSPDGPCARQRQCDRSALAALCVALSSLWAPASSAQTPKSADAFQVAQGCDAPRSIEGSQTFFVDPSRGAKGNDGSADRPWRTLSEVLDPANHLVATKAYGRTKEGLGPPAPINPGGPIRPGDTIVLMSGDHGSADFRQYANDAFISVVAGKGQTPIVRSLRMTASSHWLFRGIKFQGMRPEGDKQGPLVGLLSHGWLGPSSDIIFIDNSFSTEDSTAEWRPEDWVEKPYADGMMTEARCATIANNHFFNLRDAISVRGDQSLIDGNLIEDFGNDGIDIMASDLVIKGNRIRSGRHTPAEPLHPDAIQGWTLRGATNRNVIIDSNSIVNLNQAADNLLQGISIFDGRWDGLTVVNNLVVTNAWHGISLYGVDNALVINNTVAPSRPERFPAPLVIHDAKDKTPSRGDVVRNNIASELIITGSDIKFDHNIAEKKIAYDVDGRVVNISSGSFGDHNIIDPYIFRTFVDFELKAGKTNLRPLARSPATGEGSAELAPPVDNSGKPRRSPIDIGAFAR
jgi:hypothetical protein